MQAAKTLTTTQRTRRRPIHFLITTITFGMNAMVEGRPRQLKMPRLDAYALCNLIPVRDLTLFALWVERRAECSSPFTPPESTR
jgi:phosphatidylglycerophosphatase A